MSYLLQRFRSPGTTPENPGFQRIFGVAPGLIRHTEADFYEAPGNAPEATEDRGQLATLPDRLRIADKV